MFDSIHLSTDLWRGLGGCFGIPLQPPKNLASFIESIMGNELLECQRLKGFVRNEDSYPTWRLGQNKDHDGSNSRKDNLEGDGEAELRFAFNEAHTVIFSFSVFVSERKYFCTYPSNTIA
jgi:hypothetical protein